MVTDLMIHLLLTHVFSSVGDLLSGVTKGSKPHLAVRVKGEVAQQLVAHTGQVTSYTFRLVFAKRVGTVVDLGAGEVTSSLTCRKCNLGNLKFQNVTKLFISKAFYQKQSFIFIYF